MIRDVSKDRDAQAITDIYNHYIRETVISFEEVEITASEIADRIESVTANLPWLVFEKGENVIGYAYAGRWHRRSAYRHTVETSVYLHPDHTGLGIGKLLYEELLRRLRRLDIHSAIGGVALPNPASVALHEAMGFQKAAHYKRVGKKFGRWIDVGYWQLHFDDAPSTDS